MNKVSKRTIILTNIVCLLPVLAGALLYNRLPEQIVTHWDAAGNPNGWSSRFTGAIVFPGILFLVNLAFPILLKIDPKYNNISDKIKTLLHWIIPAVALFASTSTLAEALGYNTRVQFTTPLFIGLIFTIIGNYLPKMSQTYTVGIKLPWTLADEDNWDRTHRFAGRLWVVCGILIMITTFLHVKPVSIIILAVVMVAAPTIFSLRLFLQKNK